MQFPVVPQDSILCPLLCVINVNDIYKASSIIDAIISADPTLTANLDYLFTKTRNGLENKLNSEINKKWVKEKTSFS